MVRFEKSTVRLSAAEMKKSGPASPVVPLMTVLGAEAPTKLIDAVIEGSTPWAMV